MEENLTTVYSAETLAAETEAGETQALASSGEYNLDEPASLGEAAGIMGKGLLGVFVVIGVIILCVYALNNIGKKGKKKKEEDK